MRVPLVDLAWQHREIARDVDLGLKEVIQESSFIRGRQVADFESAFARFAGIEHCIGVGSGTDALELSLRALDIGPGDRVLVPANSFIASALGVIRAGAQVALVDCDPETYLMDIDQAVALIDSTTRAVMPVHLYGQMAPADLLSDLPDRVSILEDAAQAQGATRHGKGIGSLGRVTGTSFYPGKNIGAYGDAGAVLTSEDDLAERVRRLGNWGSERKYHHSELGFNSRLDTVQAVILNAKLSRLNEWNEARALAAKRYDQLLAEVEAVQLPKVLEGNTHVWHLYVVRIPLRDRVLERMHAAGVEAGIHYPVPMHLQGALSRLGYGLGDFPATESAAEEILSLPIYPGIDESQQEFVIDSLRKAMAVA